MGDYVLPDLPYDFGALEPHCSGQIVELHRNVVNWEDVTHRFAAVQSTTIAP